MSTADIAEDKSDAQKVSAHNGIEHVEFSHQQLSGAQLGTLQLELDGCIVLSPTPSNDPNDPLNWSQPFKIYICVVVCLAVFMSNFLAAGPTVSIVQIALDFTGPAGGLPFDIPKTAYLFSASALWQGAGVLVWMPLVAKYGRRPVYVLCYSLFFLCVVWAALAKTYAPELVARMGIGLFSSGAECLAPVTITDIFFAHERGTYMGFYMVFLSVGVSFGIVVSGLVVHGTGNWRDIYWVGAGLIGSTGLLVFFTFPETAFRRVSIDESHIFERKEPGNNGAAESTTPTLPKKSWIGSLALYMLWATLAWAVTIGFLVAITTNFAVATGDPPYNFTTLQSSLCFIGGMAGGLAGIPFAGHFGDWIVWYSTHKNDGIREPEMRLPAMYPYIILGPLSLILYGVGTGDGLTWICPVIGLALLLFTIVGAANLSLVYCLDIYKPISAEVVAAIIGFKGIIGFGLSFGTNPWIAAEGYSKAFGEMALISGVVLALAIPLNIWGGRIRQASFQWRITNWIKWDVDRDDVAPSFH